MKKENLYKAVGMIDDEYIESVNRLRTNRKSNKNKYLKIIAVAACFSLVFTAVTFAFLGNSAKAEDLMEGITPQPVQPVELFKNNANVADFALRLAQATNVESEGENLLISPLSVMCALSMTVNGANGETKAQMEEVLGITSEELNGYIYTYISSLESSGNAKFNIANSIWFKNNGINPKRDFLQINADYYNASIYKAPFDKTTLNDINNWVKKNTEGMIPSILNNIPDTAVMYLINALAFEAEWKDKYCEEFVKNGEFTLEDGGKKNVEYMYSSEDYYLETDNATGFLKEYKNTRYAFVALLPNENVSVASLLSSLDGKTVHSLLQKPTICSVDTKMPKFQTEYSVEMKDVLCSMGMTDAFDAYLADFSKMADGDLCINRVLHKTFITVDEAGTRAGAATAVELTLGGMPDEPKKVYLDRPFVYMLVDRKTDTPFFIGTMMNP